MIISQVFRYQLRSETLCLIIVLAVSLFPVYIYLSPFQGKSQSNQYNVYCCDIAKSFLLGMKQPLQSVGSGSEHWFKSGNSIRDHAFC